MESKKDIGRYFRENLENLDHSPAAKVWEGIEAELNEKKKKRRVFLWFFFAAFLCGSLFTYTLGVFHPFGEDGNNRKQPVTHTSDAQNQNDRSEPAQIILRNTTASAEENGDTNVVSDKDANSPDPKTPENSRAKKAIGQKSLLPFKKAKRSQNATAIAVNYKKGGAGRGVSIRGKRGSIASTIRKDTLQNTSSGTESSTGKDIHTTAEAKMNALVAGNTNPGLNTDSLTKLKTDSLLVNTVKTKEKKKRAAEKDSAVTTPPKQKEFHMTIAPYFGYSYYGNLGNGNPISDRYTITDESRALTENYGVLLRWMGTEKLGIQTGIGLIRTQHFTTIQKNGNFISQSNAELDYPAQTINDRFVNDNYVKFTEENRYLEVPLEAYYILSHKKFGMATAFGVSMIFNQKNEIFVESVLVEKFKIGSSKTVAPMSFSGNAKLHLFYTISKRFQFDLYPEFQYQISGYKDISNYHPYFFSIKTGVSYKL